LIYEEISKHNTRPQDDTPSKIRARSLKTEESSSNNYQSRKSNGKRISRCISHESEHSANEDIKTIKKTDVIKKKTYFDEWERPCTRGPSAEKKLKEREEVRTNPYFKSIKATAVRLRRWTTSETPSQYPMKALGSNKNAVRK
jgi:DNA helicase IV